MMRFPRRALLALPAALLACSRKESHQALPDLGMLPALPLEDQSGRHRTLTDYQGKILLVAFFFTRCPSICPRLIARMQEMEAALKDAAIPSHLAAISVDPEFDKPDVLLRYADARGIRADSFSLLTGSAREISKAAEENFKIGVSGSFDDTKPDLGITHGSHVILIDARGHIRGFIRTFDDDAIETLLQQVRSLERAS